MAIFHERIFNFLFHSLFLVAPFIVMITENDRVKQLNIREIMLRKMTILGARRAIKSSG